MTWQSLLDENIKKFIIDHEHDDVATLGLKKAPDEAWDYPLILDQIKARQKAAVKMSEWLAHETVVFPPSFVMEQASSAACALYKAALVDGNSFVDLTGGSGADAWAFSRCFASGAVVERDEGAAALLAHNLPLLSNSAPSVFHQDADVYMSGMGQYDFAYIDPQRRDAKAKGKFRFEECSPDILKILPELLDKSGQVMIKTSPMLDIRAACEVLGAVNAVHVVEWRGDCREVLYLLSGGEVPAVEDIPITAVEIDDGGCVLKSVQFTAAEEAAADVECSAPLAYFYEPSAAFQKAGGFSSMAAQFKLKKLHTHTHLYTSDEEIRDFPGRVFRFCGVYAPKSKDIPMKKAHLKVRNFPQKADILRKKLKLSDGGDEYLFACTLADGRKCILHGRKINGI